MGPTTRLLFPLVVVLATGPWVVDCGASEDAFICEEAVAYMASCCPGRDMGVVLCEALSSGCGRVYIPATLELGDSRCILALDCATIQARNLCARTVDRARQARAVADGGATDAGMAGGRLCE